MTSSEMLKVFRIKSAIPDSVIESNPMPLFDLDEDLFLVLPSYMAWCLGHSDLLGSTVIDGTVLALGETGRAKYSDKGFSRFKYQCNEEQKAAVLWFLNWCLASDFMVEEYAKRALKQWSKPSICY